MGECKHEPRSIVVGDACLVAMISMQVRQKKVKSNSI
jgi:hypothetical protein